MEDFKPPPKCLNGMPWKCAGCAADEIAGERDRETEIERQRRRQTDRQTDRQGDRQTDSQSLVTAVSWRLQAYPI
eukprot:2732150-Rhodomonas_salina.1